MKSGAEHDNRLGVEKNIVKINDKCTAKSLLDSVDYILTDCDGVLYLNNQTIPGTPELFDKLREMGKKILFVSNNSTRSRLELQVKFEKMGFRVSLDEIFVTSYVAAEYFKSRDFQDEVRLIVDCCLSLVSLISSSLIETDSRV